MARKRKWAGAASDLPRPCKRPRPTNREVSSHVHHDVLSSFYPRVCSLRAYLLSSLPATSRVRRRTLTAFRKDDAPSILDTCLVGVLKQPSLSVRESRTREFAAFTQTLSRTTASDSSRPQSCSIEEVGQPISICSLPHICLTSLDYQLCYMVPVQ